PYAFDTSSVVPLRSPFRFVPDTVTPCLLAGTLTTRALDPSRSRWFGACLRRPAPRGLPSSRTDMAWRTVINVADVTQPEMLGDEVIERVEVNLGEDLAGLVARGRTSPPFGGREQVVAGEPHQHRVLGVAVVDDRADEPQDVRVFDLAGDQPLEDAVIHRG